MALDIRRIARAISAIENAGPEARDLLLEAYSGPHSAPIVGIAGPPGAGKSTLVDLLAVHWADRGENVAIIAIDPASPFTGGAVLGDRFRMDRAAGHPRIFLRSLSSRGRIGGLSAAATDVVVGMGALGFDRVIVETVGSGQNDVDIARLADCVVVVAVPGLGDWLQAAKAGILEIGDIYGVNKSDLPGAERIEADLGANLRLAYPGRPGANPPDAAQGGWAAQETLGARHGSPETGLWHPPIVRLSSRQHSGIADLTLAVDTFLDWQKAAGLGRARRIGRIVQQIRAKAESDFWARFDRAAGQKGGYEDLAARVMRADGLPGDMAALVLRAMGD